MLALLALTGVARADEAAASGSVSLEAGLPADDGGAPDSDNPLEQRADIGLVIGPKVGGGIGAPLNEFGGSFVGELELGYLLPLSPPIGHSIELFVSGQYTQPQTDGSEGELDDRLPGDGSFTYELTQQELTLTLGGIYHIPVGSDLLMPYGGIGGRWYMMRTKVDGEVAGEAFGENEETDNTFGVLVMGGVDFFLGPGALLAELQFGFAPADAFVLRDTNVGALNLAVGYRFIL